MSAIQEMKPFHNAPSRGPTRCGHRETIVKCEVISSLGANATVGSGTDEDAMTPTLPHAGAIAGARIGSAARLLSLYLFISLLSAPLPGIDRDRRLDELYHTSWTSKDGAPSEIFAIAQARDGYLWLGTTTGLVRFDGIHFENY